MNLMEKYLWKLESTNQQKPGEDGFPAGFHPVSVSLPATPENFQIVFERADSEIDGAYIPGTLEFIRDVLPELTEEIDQAEDQVNLLWLQAREGAGDMDTFRGAVDTWKKLHLRGIRFFSIYERQGLIKC